MQSEKRFLAVLLLLGDDGPMIVPVELVNHDPVVSRDVLDLRDYRGPQFGGIHGCLQSRESAVQKMERAARAFRTFGRDRFNLYEIQPVIAMQNYVDCHDFAPMSDH